MFYNLANHGRGGTHGDDFYVLGTRQTVDEMGKTLRSKYDLREAYRLGFGDHCVREARVLNRVVTLSHENGRKAVRIEADARHVDLILQDLGLDSTRTKPVVHPGAKLTQADVDKRQQEPELDRKQAARYRSNVMRASFIAQDRPDIAEAVKSLAQFMSKPTAGAWQDLISTWDDTYWDNRTRHLFIGSSGCRVLLKPVWTATMQETYLRAKALPV